MARPMHLMRVEYRTDVSDDEPDYPGKVSGTIPDPAHYGYQIVGVDWSERGWVSVTYLIPGTGTPA